MLRFRVACVKGLTTSDTALKYMPSPPKPHLDMPWIVQAFVLALDSHGFKVFNGGWKSSGHPRIMSSTL